MWFMGNITESGKITGSAPFPFLPCEVQEAPKSSNGIYDIAPQGRHLFKEYVFEYSFNFFARKNPWNSLIDRAKRDLVAHVQKDFVSL